MDPRLQMEIRLLAERFCPIPSASKPIEVTSWKAGFHAFAELVDKLHKQNSITSSAWIDANTRTNPYMTSLDQAVADHDEIVERSRRARQIEHELAATRAFASDALQLQKFC